MNQIRHIYWFAFYNDESPSVRYRGQLPLAYFNEKHGVKSTLIIPSYQLKKIGVFVKAFCAALFFCRKNDLIVIQRVHSNFIYSSLLKILVLAHRKNTVYDLDDADYLYCKPDSIYYFVKKCNSLSAGSNAIAGHLSHLNKNIVITTSPTPDLGIVKKKRSTTFTIGWIGSFGGDHKKSVIELVFPAIKQLNFDCKFVLLGVIDYQDIEFIEDYFRENKNIQLDIPPVVKWKDEALLQTKISAFDVGIATLLDNEIQRSKSGIKAKQYLNNGVPVLGTNLPENDWVIKHGVNGYFCNDSAAFLEKIIEFKQMSEEEYAQFSKKARASITRFNHNAYYAKFREIHDLQIGLNNAKLRNKKQNDDQLH